MFTVACIIDGCNKPQRTRRLCHRHYAVALRTGELDKYPPAGRSKDLAGRTFGRLTPLCPLDERTPDGQVRWLFRCECGSQHEATGSEVARGNVRSCGCVTREWIAENWATPDDQVTYFTIHLRLKRHRGSASTHVCVDCARAAAEWSLRPGRGVRHDPATNCWFSLDLGDYEPRCVKCHRAHDKRQRNG